MSNLKLEEPFEEIIDKEKDKYELLFISIFSFDTFD